MPFDPVHEPVRISEAFSRTDDGAILSQAATLLILGARLRGDRVVNAPSFASLDSGIDAEDNELAALGVPHLRPTFGHISSERLRKGLSARYGVAPVHPLAEPEKTLPMLHDIANRLLRAPEDVAAAELMETALNHPHELVRVAAAASYFDRSSQPEPLLGILRLGTKSVEPLIRSVAATALAHIAPDDDVLRDLKLPGPSQPGVSRPTRTNVIVPGTWAANSPWWQPAGDFFVYLTTAFASLARTAPFPPQPNWDAPYGAADYFRWTGGYSDAARSQAAQDLSQWVQAHNAAGLDLITHSHGGNIAFLATQSGLQIKELVALSCPVHFPKYEPNFANVRKIASVRVHLDLVILADRGGQRFNDPRISENILPRWFDHFATHDPGVWAQYGVPGML
jgi:hypothetical protein